MPRAVAATFLAALLVLSLAPAAASAAPTRLWSAPVDVAVDDGDGWSYGLSQNVDILTSPTFDPATMYTPAEVAAAQVRAEIHAALTELDSDAQNLETLTTITLRQTQLGLARTNRSLAKLIRYLDQRDVI